MFVVQGNSVDIPVHVTRGAMVHDAINVSVIGAPAGVAVGGITIAPDSSDGTLSVVTTADAKQASLDLKISANVASGAQATGTLPIFVRGAPGAVDTTFTPDSLAIAVATNESTQGTLTSMIVAGTVDNGARLVKVDAEGKSVANTNLGIGRHVAPLPDGRLLNIGTSKAERFSDKLVLDPTFGSAGVAAIYPSTGSEVDDVAVFNGSVLVFSDVPNAASTEVTRWSADGVRDPGYATCTFGCLSNAVTLGAHPLGVDSTG